MHLQHNKSARPTGSIPLLALTLAAALAAGPIAAQPQPVPAGVASDGESGGELAALRRARDTLMRIRDYNAALNPAQTAVARQEQAPAEGYAQDLAALATIQAEVGELDTAEATFLKAIDLIETAEGEFSITLVEPYRGLGRSYIKAARFPEAIVALESAQHVSQRNLGLFNVEQAPLIDDITTAYLGIGNTIEARSMQLERLDNAVKRYGPNDPRVVPFRYQLADYYQRSRMPVSAREQYAEVLKSQEAELGGHAPSLLDPLRQLAKIDLMIAQGEEDQTRAQLLVVLEQNPDIDPLERGLSLATLGDWATVSGDTAGARSYYSQAWSAMSTKADLDVESFFATPVMLDFVAPLSSVDRGTRSKPYSWAQITFAFDVSAEGRTFNVTTVGREGPPGPIDARYTRRLRETHFRPRLVAGEPVPTDNVQFTHYFRFYVDDKDEDEG